MHPVQMLIFEFNYGQHNQAAHKKLPVTAPYHIEFNDAAFHSFRKHSKKSYYAFLYGSFSEQSTWNEFHHMYLMGGEL